METKRKKIPVLIDCDTGIDDMISFVWTLASDQLDILGVTTVAGNINLELTTYNTCNGLALMGRKEIPVAKGEAKPLERPLRDASEIHGETGLGKYVFQNPTDKQIEPEDAVEFLYHTLMASKEPVVILALAPLTNIAKLLLDHPQCKEKIEKIIFMGGSICSGNPTPVATFNVWVDPEAAKLVLKSGVPFYMCPLDTTREGYATEEDIEAMGKVPNPVAEMVHTMCGFYKKAEFQNVNAEARFKGLCIHDLCTAAYLTNPELFTTKKYYVDVETKGELTTGFTMIDHENVLQKTDAQKNVYYIDSVNREEMMKLFFKALNSYTN